MAETPRSREVALRRCEACLLVVDMQNLCVHPSGGTWSEGHAPTEYYRERIPEVMGATAALLAAARAAGGGTDGGAQAVERVFTVIESLTHDGRDRSLDYKLSGFNVPRGSWGAAMPACIAPRTGAGEGADEIVLPKCSSSVFVSTNVSYKLRNLGVRQVRASDRFASRTRCPPSLPGILTPSTIRRRRLPSRAGSRISASTALCGTPATPASS